MTRIFITGNAGAGKSTLARSLGKTLALPVYSLDQIVWQSGWRKTPDIEKKQRIEQLLQSTNDWIIEGVSQTVLQAADTVIFLDVPRRVCFWRCFKRNSNYLFRSRPELPEDCPEIQIIPQLIRIIWNFPKNVRPSILDYVERNPHKRFIHTQQTTVDLELILTQLPISIFQK